MLSRFLLVSVLIAGLLALPAARSDDAKRGPTQAKDVPAKTVTLDGKIARRHAREHAIELAREHSGRVVQDRFVRQRGAHCDLELRRIDRGTPRGREDRDECEPVLVEHGGLRDEPRVNGTGLADVARECLDRFDRD